MTKSLELSFGRFNNRRISVIGDSLTQAYYFGFQCRQYFPTILQGLLNGAGCHALTRNFGVGGNTSGQVAARAAALNFHETPELAIIWAGTNDFGSAGAVNANTLANPSGTTAVFTANGPHGMQTGDSVVITGATPSAYNGTFSVTVSDPVTFTYTLGSGGNANATGTVTSTPAAVSTVGGIARTQANIQAATKCAKFGALGFVTGQANLPVGRIGQRYVVMNDTDATGGVAAITPGQMPNLTGAGGGGQYVWEYRLPLAGNAGWGRVAGAATTPSHCDKIIVVGQHYMNWSGGGDNRSTATIYSQYNASNGLRGAQAAAAAAENNAVFPVVYCDLYNFLAARIAAGLDTQGSFGWHVADSNVHLNAYGQSLVATALYNTIAAQPGWLTALS